MAELTVISMPFTFPASDAFVLRGTVLMPIEIVDENLSSDRPVESRPVERPTGGYSHPFLAPEADAGIVASPDDDALPFVRSPFVRSPWEGNGSQVSEWGTADGSEPEYSRGVVVVSGAFAIQHKFYGRF
ncbi:MAG TPA: hypothetical protein VLA29_10050, partial [Acidimicrobiia bacterium]|nr:hypothetical protein [Acidimicrobiia bacterium]